MEYEGDDVAIVEVSVQLDVNEISTSDIDKDTLTHVFVSKDQKVLIKSKVMSQLHQIDISLLEEHKFVKSDSNQGNHLVDPKTNQTTNTTNTT